MRYIVSREQDKYGVVDIDTGVCRLYYEWQLAKMLNMIVGANTDGITVYNKKDLTARIRLLGFDYDVDSYLEVGHRYKYETERHQFHTPCFRCIDLDTDRVVKFKEKVMTERRYQIFKENGISFSNIVSYRKSVPSMKDNSDKIYLRGLANNSFVELYYMCKLMKSYLRGSIDVPNKDNSFFCSGKYNCDARWYRGILYLTSDARDYCYSVKVYDDYRIKKSQYLPSRDYIVYTY